MLNNVRKIDGSLKNNAEYSPYFRIISQLYIWLILSKQERLAIKQHKSIKIRMQTTKESFLALVLFLLTFPQICKAQSSVMEVSWNVSLLTIQGCFLYPNNQGILKICSYDPNIGTIWIEQDATVTNQYDVFGNCTSYINCRNSRASPI